MFASLRNPPIELKSVRSCVNVKMRLTILVNYQLVCLERCAGICRGWYKIWNGKKVGWKKPNNSRALKHMCKRGSILEFSLSVTAHLVQKVIEKIHLLTAPKINALFERAPSNCQKNLGRSTHGRRSPKFMVTFIIATLANYTICWLEHKRVHCALKLSSKNNANVEEQKESLTQFFSDDDDGPPLKVGILSLARFANCTHFFGRQQQSSSYFVWSETLGSKRTCYCFWQ